MNRPVSRWLIPAVLSVTLGVGGCGFWIPKTDIPGAYEPRAACAEEMFYAKVSAASNREPNFDEKRQFKDHQMDEKVFKCLRDHPEIEQTTRYSEFRFGARCPEGSTPGEVRALLDEPLEQTTDPGLMKMKAKVHWAQISTTAKEAWTYPLGWVLYFDDKGVTDMIRRVDPHLLSHRVAEGGIG